MFTQFYRARLANASRSLTVTVSTTTSRKYSIPTDSPKSKLWRCVDEAVKDIKSGDVLMCGGPSPCRN